METSKQDRRVRLAVVGSRTYNDHQRIFRGIDAYLERIRKQDIRFTLMQPHQFRSMHVDIVSGGAEGVDTVASNYAMESLGRQAIEFPVTDEDWKRYGRAAGPRRNTQIIARATHVLAFWNGYSRGTGDSIKKARASKKPLRIVRVDKEEERR